MGYQPTRPSDRRGCWQGGFWWYVPYKNIYISFIIYFILFVDFLKPFIIIAQECMPYITAYDNMI